MKKIKHLTVIIAVCAFFAVSISALSLDSGKTLAQTSAGFSDIASSPYKSAILYVGSKGVVQGYSDGTYRPDAKINRAEFTKIVMASTHGTELSTYAAKSCFSDVPASAWFSKYVCLGHDDGIIGGYPDLTFKPDQNINAAEALKITLSAFFGSGSKIPTVSGPDWYDKYLDFSEKYSLKPSAWADMGQNITRGEMAQFIYQILAPQSPGKITISLAGTQLVPFSIVTINGTGFNPLAATSVVFTTSDKHIYTVPALSVTANAIEVGVPPVNYDASKSSFSSAGVSMKVIQVTDNYSAFASVTSNQITGLTITAPVYPSVYGSVAANVPKGSVSVSFLAASLQSLQDVQAKLPNGVSSDDLTKAENQIQTMMNVLKTFSQNPTAPVTLTNADGSTTTLQPADVAQLDAIYLGILGQLEGQKIVAYENGLWAFLPVVHAQSAASTCVQEGLGGGAGDVQLEKLYGEACMFADAAQKAHDQAAPLLPEALKFVYTIPLQVSSVMLDAVSEAVFGLAKVGQLAVASTYAFVTDALANGNSTPQKPLEAIGESTLDGKFSAPGVPLFGVANSSLEFFRRVSEAISPDDKAKGQVTAVVSDSTDASKVKLLEMGSDGKALVSDVNVPAPGSSALQSKPGFEIAQPTPPPAQAPATQQSTQQATQQVTPPTSSGECTPDPYQDCQDSCLAQCQGSYYSGTCYTGCYNTCIQNTSQSVLNNYNTCENLSSQEIYDLMYPYGS